MRFVFTLMVVLMATAPGFSQPDTAGARPAEATNPAATAADERNAARWADTEAEGRVTDGDYEGAVQAEHQAEIDRREAADQDSREPKR